MELACMEYANIKVTFHGGEPTLAGYGFYKAFFRAQQELVCKYQVNIKNIITTNGLLLTNELIDLFKENSVQICISYDGPYNSILRQHSEKVLSNILLAKSKGADLKCYCTLSKYSVNYLDEIYYWFRDNFINFKILPIEKRGYAATSNDHIMSISELVANFAQTYLIWLKDGDCKVSCSTFEEFAKLRRTTQHRKYWFGRKIAMHSDGNLYTFGRPNDIKFSLGPVSKIDSLSQCFDSKYYLDFLSFLKQQREQKCSKCRSSVICGGVNINIAYLYVNDKDLVDYSCSQCDSLFQCILDINDQVIKDFKNGEFENYNDYVKFAFSKYKTNDEHNNR